MSTQFNWHTEEDGEWRDDRPEKSGDNRRRRLILLLTSSLLIGLLAAVFYRQVSQHLNAAQQSVEEELVANFLFVQNLRRPDDAELLANFLSGRDEGWAHMQEQLLREGLRFDRPSLALRDIQDELTEEDVAAISLTPSLVRAEITATRRYAIEVGNGLTETIQLQQVSIYRLGHDRWLFAPPEQEFWGASNSHTGQYLTASYPSRDKALVERLLLQLERKLSSVCGRADLDCLPTFHLELQFATDPAALRLVQTEELSAGEPLILPTPTLVGWPIDEAAYDALYRGYAGVVVAEALLRATGRPCCNEGIRDPILQQLLAELGLRPWPLSGDDYDQLVRGGITLDALSLPPTERSEDDRLLYAAVDFLVHELEMKPMTLLVEGYGEFSPPLLLRALIQLAAEQGLEQERLRSMWQLFLYHQSTLATSEPPLPRPTQDLLLACQVAETGQSAIYRYDLSSDRWEQIHELGNRRSYLRALPDGQGVLVTRLAPQTAAEAETFVWRNGLEIQLAGAELAAPSSMIPLTVDPTGRYILMHPGDFRANPPYALLDLDSCTNESCTVTELSGYPTWSPDGEQTLIQLGRGNPTSDYRTPGTHYLGDAAGRRLQRLEVEGSITPFWIEEDTLGFIATGLPVAGVMTATLPAALPASEPLLSTQSLTALLGESVEYATIIHAIRGTDGKSPVFLTVTDLIRSNMQYEIVSVDPVTREATVRLTLFDIPLAYRFAGDGRWLAILTPSQLFRDQYVVYLHEIPTMQTRRYAFAADLPTPLYWEPPISGDGEWLVWVHDGYLQLVAPAYDYYQYLQYEEQLDCTTAVWVNAD